MDSPKAMRLYCILISVEHQEHSYSFGPEFVAVSRYSKCNLRLEIGPAIPQGRPRLLSKNDPSGWKERRRRIFSRWRFDLNRSRWEVGGAWSMARGKSWSHSWRLSLSLSFSLKLSELLGTASRERERKRDGENGIVPCTCEISCESWHIARRGSCFRETTLDEDDGDGGGSDVPRYPYAICMEENMRTPVYNLAAANGRSVWNLRACAPCWRRRRAHWQKPAPPVGLLGLSCSWLTSHVVYRGHRDAYRATYVGRWMTETEGISNNINVKL